MLTSIAPNVRAIFLWMPIQGFTIAEINALKTFAGEGGRIVLMAENEGAYGPTASGGYVNGVPTMNTFLSNMGSGMANAGNVFAIATTLTPSSFTDHPILTGVTSLALEAASRVTLGANDAALFRDAENTNILGAVARVTLTPLSPPPIGVIATAPALGARNATVPRSASSAANRTGVDPVSGRQLP